MESAKSWARVDGLDLRQQVSVEGYGSSRTKEMFA